ncbi:hypothetical protein ACFQYP_11910 [Nonomuraea antimicrobica]
MAVAGLVTAAVPAAGVSAHSRAASDYDDVAAAIVDFDGKLNNGRNVITSWRAGVGRYCVQLAPKVDAARSLIQVTPRVARRVPYIAYRNPSETCSRHNTLTIAVYEIQTGRLADSGFDLLVL